MSFLRFFVFMGLSCFVLWFGFSFFFLHLCCPLDQKSVDTGSRCRFIRIGMLILRSGIMCAVHNGVSGLQKMCLYVRMPKKVGDFFQLVGLNHCIKITL